MKRKLKIAACVIVGLVAIVFGATKLAVRHERMPLFDTARNRSVPVDLYVRRDKEMKAMAGLEVVVIDADTRDITQTIYIRKVEKKDGKLANVEFDQIPDVKDPGK